MVAIEPRTAVVLAHRDSPERQGSTQSANTVEPALSQLGWKVRRVDAAQPAALQRILEADLAFIAGHGWYSEDGKLQGLLEILNVPYTGSGVLASAIAMHKPSANAVLAQAGLPVPQWQVVDLAAAPDAEAKRLCADLGLPVFIKPVSGGGSIGAGIAETLVVLEDRLTAAQAEGPHVTYLATEYVEGLDLSVGLIELHGQVEILPILATHYEGQFYDYEIKHDPKLRRHTCPADLRPELSDEIRSMARQAFDALNCHGVARVDFILDAHQRPWFLEVNTVPGLSTQGNLATMAQAAGLAYAEIIEAIALTAFTKGTYIP